MMHRQDGRQEIDRRTCIEVFYNQRRRHSTLGQISPAAFERRAAAA
jgi:transposase InsO family protein